MDNNLYIPDMYPVRFLKTITLKVGNIAKYDGTPVGYSFTAEDGNGLIVNFNQFISIHPLHPQKIILNAYVGLARYGCVIDQDPLINGCFSLLPPGNKLLEYYIIDAYDGLKACMGEPLKRVNVMVKWPGKEE